MVYTKRDKLAVIELTDNKSDISLKILSRIMIKHPSNVIYCEREGKLIGIISMGDIARANNSGNNSIRVNKKYISVYRGAQIKARRIFRDKKSINAIPVVTYDNELLGDYSRWDDILQLKDMLNIIGRCGLNLEKAYKQMTLVRPCGVFKEKQELFEIFKDYLQSMGIKVQCIEYSQVPDYPESDDLMLFVEENEMRAMNTLREITWDRKQERKTELRTYKQILMFSQSVFLKNYLRSLLDKGIYILGIEREPVGDGNKYLQKEMIAKFAKVGQKLPGMLHPSMYEDFFDDLYSEDYANQILSMPFKARNMGGAFLLKDCQSLYCNVMNGERYTDGQPEHFEQSIYFFGPCYIYGHYVEDKNTIESILQKRLNHEKAAVKVVNCGYLGGNNSLNTCIGIMRTVLKRGDIIVIDCPPLDNNQIKYIKLEKILEANKVGVEWLLDHPVHCNHKVNALYADAVYNALKPAIYKSVERQGEVIDKDTDFIKLLYLDRYFSEFDASKYERTGSIVMNCNPFTYGHYHLIEQALKIVDFLIIFVVEEDASLFSFAERFTMVKDGVAGLENIMVVPSGPFILSKLSFPEYFIKETSEDIIEHTEQDIVTFAKNIAPRLGIKYRFVGEEPEDMVTHQYNLAMKKILPEYNIKFVEIPRKEIRGQYISASFVRKCLEENDSGQLKELLPDTTRKLLEI